MKKVANIYFKYPVAIGFLTQIFSSVNFLLGSSEFKDVFYSSYWVAGSLISPLMDNNINAAIRSAAKNENAPRVDIAA